MTPKDNKDKYENMIGDWQYQKVVIKAALRVCLCWFGGFIISIFASVIAVFFLEVLFDRDFDCFPLFMLLGMIGTFVFTTVMLVKYIRELKSSKDDFSKLDWIVMERRITQIEGGVIVNIIGTLVFFVLLIHEIIDLLK